METKINEYEQQALDFMQKHNCKLKIVRNGERRGFPNEPHDRNTMHIRHKVEVITERGHFFVTFYGSHNDWCKQKKATPYDILADLSMYIYTRANCPTLHDFCQEYGYDEYEDRNRAARIYKGCLRLCDCLHEVFDDAALDDLSEIN